MADEDVIFVDRLRAPWCILCMCCKRPLTNDERKDFLNKGLKTFKKWNNGKKRSFGCCETCCVFLANEEAEKTRAEEIHLEADGVQLFCGAPLRDISMNCRYCLAVLTFYDKYLNKENRLPFCLRRKKWRGTCEKCLKDKKQC